MAQERTAPPMHEPEYRRCSSLQGAFAPDKMGARKTVAHFAGCYFFNDMSAPPSEHRREPMKKTLSFLLSLVMALTLWPAAALADQSAGEIVMSFEYYDAEEETVALLRGPEAVAFTD